MEIVVVEEQRQEASAVVRGVIRAGVGPLAGEGLDEAFGLAVGLRAIGTGEEMTEAQRLAGGGEEFGAIGGALVGEDGLDGDAVSLIESQGLMEGGQDAGSFFIGEKTGESQAGMIINGDVKGLDASAWIAMGTVAGGADAGLMETAKLFNIQMKQFTGGGAFVTDDWRLGRVERTEAVEAVAAQDAGEGGFGDGQGQEDLSVGTALAAESQDLGLESW